MHVFIDFSLLNLSFLSCHGVVGGGGGVFFLNKVVRARTGECEPCVIINIESLAIACYASSLFFLFFFFFVTHTFNVTFHRCSISYKTRAKAENGWREKKNLAEENLRDRLMPRWYFSVSGQGLLR